MVAAIGREIYDGYSDIDRAVAVRTALSNLRIHPHVALVCSTTQELVRRYCQVPISQPALHTILHEMASQVMTVALRASTKTVPSDPTGTVVRLDDFRNKSNTPQGLPQVQTSTVLPNEAEEGLAPQQLMAPNVPVAPGHPSQLSLEEIMYGPQVAALMAQHPADNN